MGDATKIEWCDRTFNPWVGCSKVHAGCANCYAEADFDKRRHFAQWGPMGTRVMTSTANWVKPRKWNREAEAAGERLRVFCSSLADVFEDWQGPIVDSHGAELSINDGEGANGAIYGDVTVDDDWGRRSLTMHDLRRKLFALIDETPHLDWLLLTKRPQNIRRMLVPHCSEKVPGHVSQNEGDGRRIKRRENVYLLTSVSDQQTADAMIPDLLKCRDLAPVLGLSCEPLLGPIDLSTTCINPPQEVYGVGGPYHWEGDAGIDWIIVGGESGPRARPCSVAWIRSIVDQCEPAAVPVFVKQLGSNIIFNEIEDCWGSRPPKSEFRRSRRDWAMTRDPKGGDPSEWPEDLRVREFPTLAAAAAESENT